MRNYVSHRSFGRAILSLRRKLLKKCGDEILAAAQALAERKGLLREFRLTLVESLYLPEVLSALLSGEGGAAFVKTLARWLFVPDVLRGYELC